MKMSDLYDFRQDSIRRDLDAAFAAGEQRGQRAADEDLIAEMVSLRVGCARLEAAAYREGLETAFWFVVILASIVVAAWVLL
jgi:hypothetical protein